ncbi:MAG: hypothetical protein U0527_03925 [Candidatus Eisenbacteria bacterium]
MNRPQLLLSAIVAVSGCTPSAMSGSNDDLAGAWRSSVHFDSGDFAGLSDLEFLYAFNSGGTMTESSNYDAVPPVAPAYGVEARRPGRIRRAIRVLRDQGADEGRGFVAGAGWNPIGRGRFDEHIQVSADGSSFDSTFRYSPLNPDGSPAGILVIGKAHGGGFRRNEFGAAPQSCP